MVYFNYFIKCVIRKFVNLFFNPKIFFAFLIIIVLLFSFEITSRAEWSSQDIADLQNTLSRLRTVLIEQLNELEQVKNNTQDIEYQIALVNEKLLLVNGYLNNIQNNTDNLETQLSDIASQLTIITSDILNIYNKLDENQQELLTELKVENNSVLDELNKIRGSLNGSKEEPTTFIDGGMVSSSNSSNNYERVRLIQLDYEPGYTYTIKVHYQNMGSTYPLSIRVLTTDNMLTNGFNFSSYSFLELDRVPYLSSDYVVTYEVPSTNPAYIYFTWGGLGYFKSFEVTRKMKGILENLNQSNDLQQQQNQLQQEQNNFLKDDNVVVDSSTLPSDTTQDITDSGFNNIFNTLYNTFTSGSAKDLVINIPFTNKSFVINAQNVYGNANLGLIKTLIQTFWYFIISYFIVQDIGKKINKIKSGNIENIQEDNIKEDML